MDESELWSALRAQFSNELSQFSSADQDTLLRGELTIGRTCCPNTAEDWVAWMARAPDPALIAQLKLQGDWFAPQQDNQEGSFVP